MPDKHTIEESLELVGASVSCRPRTNTADATLAITEDDAYILISSAGGSAPGTTTTSMRAGQRCLIQMTAFNTNAYTVAVDEGALTFNAADESAEIVYDGTAVRVVSLRGATIV